MRLLSWLLALALIQGPVIPNRRNVFVAGGGGTFTPTANNGGGGRSSTGTTASGTLSGIATATFFWCGAVWEDTGAGSISTDQGETVHAVGSPKTGVNTLTGFSGQVFWFVTVNSNDHVITLTTGSNAFASFNCQGYTMSSGLSPGQDGTAAYSNTPAVSTTATVSGLTTTHTNSLIAAVCLAVTSSCTLGAGYTSRDTGGWNASTGNLQEDKTTSTAGAQTATFGTGSGDDVILGLVGFTN